MGGLKFGGAPRGPAPGHFRLPTLVISLLIMSSPAFVRLEVFGAQVSDPHTPGGLRVVHDTGLAHHVPGFGRGPAAKSVL